MSEHSGKHALAAGGTTTSSPAPVTVMGLGLMGTALAGAFLKNGHPTTVWNRSARKADDLVANGAIRAEAAADAIAASSVIVVCVLDYGVVRAILEPAREALRGRVLVNLTTGTPEQARALAAWANAQGAGYLDGKIMAVPSGIGLAETLILYSGSTAIFDEHRHTLASLGGGATPVGDDPAFASLYDTALLGLMYSMLGGFFQAVALLGTENVKASTFLPLATGWLAATATFLPDVARQIDERRYGGVDATLDMQAAVMGHLVETYQARGLDPVPLTYVTDLVRRAVAAGHGAHELSSLIEVIRPSR